eukprot:4168143-Pyramimonas_sp.AAC.1
MPYDIRACSRVSDQIISYNTALHHTISEHYHHINGSSAFPPHPPRLFLDILVLPRGRKKEEGGEAEECQDM